MPSPEQQPGGQPEQPTRPEQEVTPYSRAARFANERVAGQAYFAVQDAIFTAEACDLSAYRLQLNRVSHVAVLGQPPPEELDQTIAALLAAGETTALPAEVVKLLAQRRRQATRDSAWHEGHYRPGTRLSP